MLDLVCRAKDGLTAAQVIEATGLHPSTVRAHLDQLAGSGLVTRNRHGDGTPGRPAWRYYAADSDMPVPASADSPYRGLAAALVGHLARDADDPHAAGVRAGRDWGRALAAPLVAGGPDSPGRGRPLEGLVRVLDQLGFAPRVVERSAPSATVVELRSCPFLDLALVNPDIVCGVHQGIIGGVLGVLGASTTDTSLEPFADEGVCLVRVRTRHPAKPAGAEDAVNSGPS